MNVRFNVLALVLAGLMAHTSFAADPTGTWRWEHEDLAGSGETIKDVLTIEVNDGTVSGIYSTPDGDVPIENAAMDGDALHWELNIDAQGQMFSIVFDGDIAGDDITGTVVLGDFGEFPWAAKRDGAVDPSGTWRWEHEDLEGSGEIVPDILNLTFKDGKVSGTFTSPQGDVPIENASMDGNTLRWELNIDAQGQMLKLAWTGDITGDDVTGTIAFGDFGEFPWAAKRDAVVAVDPSGTWRWEHEDLAGSGAMIKDVLTISFEDGTVAGNYDSPPITQAIENASMNGDMLHWEINLDAEGALFAIVFDGKIEGDDIAGTVSLGDFGEFPWTAKRD